MNEKSGDLLLWLSLGLPVDRHVCDVQPLSTESKQTFASNVQRKGGKP